MEQPSIVPRSWMMYILWLFCACDATGPNRAERSVVAVVESTQDFPLPIIVDPIGCRKGTLLKTVSPHLYNVLYTGRIKSPLLLSYHYYESPYSTFEGFRKNHREKTASDISLFVDTAQHICGYTIVTDVNSEVLKTNKKYHKAFPVFMVNRSTDTLVFGWNSELQLVLEVQDSSGNWRPLHQRDGVMSGALPVMVAPSQVVVTAVPLFKGRFRTLFRLRYDDAGSIVSNVYSGNIDPRLLTPPLN